MNTKMRNLTLTAAALAALTVLAPKASAQNRPRGGGNAPRHGTSSPNGGGRNGGGHGSYGGGRATHGGSSTYGYGYRGGHGTRYVAPVRPYVRYGYGYGYPTARTRASASTRHTPDPATSTSRTWAGPCRPSSERSGSPATTTSADSGSKASGADGRCRRETAGGLRAARFRVSGARACGRRPSGSRRARRPSGRCGGTARRARRDCARRPRPTARTADGLPIASASSAYERVSPRGIAGAPRRRGAGTSSRGGPAGSHERSTGPGERARDRVRPRRERPGAFSRRASGYSRLRLASSARSASPSVTAQTPRSVAATRSRPSGVATVANRTCRPLPPRAYVRGRRPEVARRVRVRAARGAVPGLEARGRDRRAFLEERLEPVRALGVRVALRRDADELLERPLEVKGRKPRDARERRERDALVRMRLEERDGAPDGAHGGGRLRRGRPAAQAGPEARGLGLAGSGEEAHVLAVRPPGRARGRQ